MTFLRITLFLISLLEFQSFLAQNQCCALLKKCNDFENSLRKEAKLKSEKMITYDYKAKLNGYDSNGRDIFLKTYDEEARLIENISFFTNTNKSQIYSYEGNNLVQAETQSPKGLYFEKWLWEYNEGKCSKSKLVNQQNKTEIIGTYILDNNQCFMSGTDSTGKSKKNSEKWIVDDANNSVEHQYIDPKDFVFKKEILTFSPKCKLEKKIFINTSFNQYIQTNYIYDENGRLIEEKYSDQQGNLKKCIKYTYGDSLFPVESYTTNAYGNPVSMDKYFYEFYK